MGIDPTTETIDITPSWSGLALLLGELAAGGSSAARTELLRMARIADRAVEASKVDITQPGIYAIQTQNTVYVAQRRYEGDPLVVIGRNPLDRSGILAEEVAYYGPTIGDPVVGERFRFDDENIGTITTSLVVSIKRI